MAQPTSIVNSLGQSTDTPYAGDGTPRVKLAVGSKSIGLTPPAGWQGAATHEDGAGFSASDGVVVGAGVDAAGNVVREKIDADGRQEVVIVPAVASLTDCSGTITAGGTAQQLAAANASRCYLLIQNVDPAEDLWIDFGTIAVASQPSIKLLPGGAFSMEGSFVTGQSVSVIAATTSHPYTAKEASRGA
jgi:hypothetical protein